MPSIAKRYTKEDFLKIWLDPTLTVVEVARKLRISKCSVRSMASRFGYRRERDFYVDVKQEYRRKRMPSKEEFTEGWLDEDLIRSDLTKRWGISKTTLIRLAREYGLDLVRPNYIKTRGVVDPTPEEIEERAAEIRKGWSESVREQRARLKGTLLK